MYIRIYTHSTAYCMNASSTSQFVWRPPYPSENLKTPRITKTYSTTNPYAVQEDDGSSQQHQQQQQQQSHQHLFQGNQDAYLNQFQESQHSKRENHSNKIYERGLTPQVGMNPFLQNSNYLQDLETQNEFLKPVNSSL